MTLENFDNNLMMVCEAVLEIDGKTVRIFMGRLMVFYGTWEVQKAVQEEL